MYGTLLAASRNEVSNLLVYCRTSTTLSERLTTLPVPYRVIVCLAYVFMRLNISNKFALPSALKNILTCGMTYSFVFMKHNNIARILLLYNLI